MSFDLKQYLVSLTSKVKNLEERSHALEERNSQLENRLHGMENKLTHLEATLPMVKPAPAAVPPPPQPAPPATPPARIHAGDGLKAFADDLLSHSALPPQPPANPEEYLKELMDGAGKANYGALKKLAREKSEREFHDIVRHPVLMGAALFRGATESQEGGDVDATVMFVATRKPAEADKVHMDLLERSIYPLLRRRPIMPGTGTTPMLSIGRMEDNDIVMPDPTISKKQAELRISQEGVSGGHTYYLRDMGSTNEIRINGTKLNSFDMVELNPGDEIKLGRFYFIFTPVARLRKKLLED